MAAPFLKSGSRPPGGDRSLDQQAVVVRRPTPTLGGSPNAGLRASVLDVTEIRLQFEKAASEGAIPFRIYSTPSPLGFRTFARSDSLNAAHGKAASVRYACPTMHERANQGHHPSLCYDSLTGEGVFDAL